jgi:hypothetical protein
VGGWGAVVEIFESSAGISSDPGSSIHQLAKLSTFNKITNFLFKAKMLNLIFKSYLFSSPLLSFDHHSFVYCIKECVQVNNWDILVVKEK